jgi:hypothetical protein
VLHYFYINLSHQLFNEVIKMSADFASFTPGEKSAASADQLGSRSARTHAFYAGKLTPEKINELCSIMLHGKISRRQNCVSAQVYHQSSARQPEKSSAICFPPRKKIKRWGVVAALTHLLSGKECTCKIPFYSIAVQISRRV